MFYSAVRMAASFVSRVLWKKEMKGKSSNKRVPKRSHQKPEHEILVILVFSNLADYLLFLDLQHLFMEEKQNFKIFQFSMSFYRLFIEKHGI